MPATNFMSALMLDPRAFMLNPLFCDPAALALLQQQVPFASLPTEQHAGGGKIVGSTANETSTTTSSSSTSAANSFRILDILESQARSNHSTSSSGGSEKANTSGENDESLEDDADDPNASSRSDLGNSLHQGNKKARKARTIFTDKQLQELESMFEKHKYLSVQDRMDLAHRMGLTDTQVKTWYQNRRTKYKRTLAVGVDLLQEPSNFAVIQNLLRTNPYWVQQCMSNPAMYPLLAQRLMPNMASVLPSQQPNQQSPSSRPQSTNNNCLNNAISGLSADPTSPNAMPQLNPFPLFFGGLSANAFGLPNTTVTSSNSANSSPGSATPSLATGQAEENTSDVDSKPKSASPVHDQKSP